MSDLREQLRKAGLVSSKQVRQARHEDRLHRKEVGRDGLEAERLERENAAREAAEEKRRRDREIEESRRASRAEEERTRLLGRRIEAGWIREATGGARRFYFVAEKDRITYLDLSDQAVRRLLGGTAAIVDACRIGRGEFCVVDGATAASLARDENELIRYWNRSGEHR